MTMKAVRFHETGSPQVLKIEELAIPEPKPDEVLIRVETAGINFADTVRRRGKHYPVPTPLPFIPGGEVIGTVEAVGAQARGHTIGETVFGNPSAGGCAEFVAVPASRVFAVPNGLDPVKGIALVIQGLTAALTLRQSARMQPGETVFVEAAAGGVGSLAIQIAKLDGAEMVIAGASTAEKRALAKSLGADIALDYTRPGWSDDILQATDGRGADVILEMSGGAILTESFKCLARFGRSIVYGNASGEAAPIAPQRLLAGNQSIVGFYLGGFLPRKDLIADTLSNLAAHVVADRLKIHVGGVFSFAGIAEAHRQLEEREATGKLVLRPGLDGLA